MPQADATRLRESVVNVRAAALRREGSSLYETSRLLPASRAYDRAATAAEAAGLTRDASEARFWQGATLHGAGRLREALAAFAEIAARRESDAVDDRTRYMALTRFVLVAVDMPLRLASIESAIEDVERFEDLAGRNRRARLLLVRARLSNLRGLHLQALDLSREGLARARIEDGAYSLGTYHKEAIRACMRLGDLDELDRLLDSWQTVRDAYAASRQVFIPAFRSFLCRHRGQIGDAIEWGRQAIASARSSDDLAERLLPSDQFIRAVQLSANAGDARIELRRLFSLQRVEPALTRFEAILLRGDYHLAMAEFHGGLPATDPESGSTFERAGQPDSDLARRSINRATRSYRAAAREGAAIDRLLDCSARRVELAAREQRLRSVALRLALDIDGLTPHEPVGGRPS
jgi:tetratricopeptide (TPR) repeat protein